jgi:hypothetical protein
MLVQQDGSVNIGPSNKHGVNAETTYCQVVAEELKSRLGQLLPNGMIYLPMMFRWIVQPLQTPVIRRLPGKPS